MSTVGVRDKSLSDRLMVFIQGGAGTVCAVLGEGATRDLQANWDSPFEQDNLGSVREKTGAVAQVALDVTSKTTFNSIQVWNGNAPHTFNLPLVFYALRDAYSEVQAAIIALEQMASPEVNAILPGGRLPEVVSVKVGRMILYPECHIEQISTDLSGPISRDGYPLRAMVNLTLQTKVSLNRSDIASSFS